jgi:asparaginyl-tRNA synthetase
MEGKDSTPQPEVEKQAQDEPITPTDEHHESKMKKEVVDEGKGQIVVGDSQEGSKKVDITFKECPVTSAYTDEELKTENSKILEEVKVDPLRRPISSYGGRLRIATFHSDEAAKYVNTEVRVCGWAKTLRSAGKGAFYFVILNDGSSIGNLQVVVDGAIEGFEQLSKEGVGTSFQFIGTLLESPKQGQKYELQVKDNTKHSMKIFGSCPQGDYPLAKKEHTKEYLREIMHLRPRTNLISVVARIRNSLSIATHEFFQKRGFLYVHTPMITASDCEGAGEMFQVTTVLPDPHLPASELKTLPDGKVDYTKDFFKKPAFLTVSGQLNVETFCCGVGDVYTFSPTFRAEISHTKKHLAEFWMIEPELAFADLRDDMDCAEEYVKYCINYVLTNHMDDLEYLQKNESKGLIKSLQHIVENDFGRVPYTEAIKQLQAKAKKAKFEVLPEWGIDLGTEHERFLTEKIYKKPIFVYNYPKDIKAFYMRSNDDGLTVAAMDCLVPQIGELIGGSQREERLDVLQKRIKEMHLPEENYSWYMELRKFGSVPHAGFGLGFERLLLLVTGIENIRDIIPFPRWPGHADF